MTSAKDISIDEVRSWVKTETAKGRPMRDIVGELVEREDITLLSVNDSPEARHQKIVDAVKKHASH